MSDLKPERAQPTEELVAITKAYDLLREMTQRVGKFPRDQIRSTRGKEIGSGGKGAIHGD